MVDELYPKAMALAKAEGSFRPALIQSELLIGFNRAMRMIEHMEDEGICTRPDADGVRHIIPTVTDCKGFFSGAPAREALLSEVKNAPQGTLPGPAGQRPANH